MESGAASKHRSKKRAIKGMSWRAPIAVVALIVIVGLFAINLPPFRAFGGAIWLKGGIHYISNAEISNRIEQLNTPKEAVIADKISNSTQTCGNLEEGFCQESPGVYDYKALITPAVAYQPGTPDKKVVTGYCTLCNDGSYSPSCAVGRGACSWHGGVAAYNVAEYRTIPGTSAVQAQPAVYSYVAKTYKDNPMYISPEVPSLKTVVGF